MPVYKWRRRPTKHFGEVWVPFASIELQGTDGKFQEFALQVDSGAVVSLLRRSSADMLGLSLKDGKEIDLSAVGGGKTIAYLHYIPTRLENEGAPRIPYAIADSEKAPNLLGRLGVFDELQVDFDSSLEETRISNRWLTPERKKIWDFIIDLEKQIQRNWDSVEMPGWSKVVALLFLRRASQLVAGAAALTTLHRPHSGPMFVRAMFDLGAQFHYLMKKPLKRAADYRDFAYITQYRKQQDFYKNPVGEIIGWVAKSPDRARGESHTKSQFDRVKARFLKPSKKHKKEKTWDKWYCMSSRDLAKKIGWENEWRLWFAISSDWLHGDPMSTQNDDRPPLLDGWEMLSHCFRYYVRMLALVSDKLVLTAEQVRVIELLRKEFA